ncbi:MAG: gliding-motility protein MglA [Bdellovibrionales bacterium RIFOXYD12_FULL_39_22]|nr:MAG: gliding-motility protein MglA [Bdellovibrionales bacterium RIFOXYB1_FULL_39_21]OFZ41393.1 MAG: gliding-motility protein MglA [Bdellovibrionales bacterium RIFOXYC12_FULL_39_17]OFZ45348.1 MAG: gliding-motility protein MglA [Bdellovibrionales bacterium RIFOXYC1_FULL_39_130]OFZ68780.1 MAG: gliding-motility protein MglA [Bdellovibrionales bacterium RIFOXYC2_FULL_39_8]OFZ74544.1 MAG: gliding-motility protein MglA [Bdellovibrionales bacterium RIFOXYD1_FULL_39_84]OFZ92553.1 MAG: gliding-motili
MSLVNYPKKEVNCKIVYYGPGMGGKTTNIQYVYKKTVKDAKGKIISINTANERTIFFDFLPLDLGEIRGFKTRFHLYSVPGQVFYESSRKLILRGVDGVVFVADSQVDRMEANIESLQSLQNNLLEQGYDIHKIPLVMQWNKRDLPNISSVENLKTELNKWNAPDFESVATDGSGVFETLKMISKLVLMNLRGGLSA